MIAYMTNASGQNSTGSTSKIGMITVPAQLGIVLNSATLLNSGTILTDDVCNDIEPA